MVRLGEIAVRQQNAIIISDSADFARTLMARWRAEGDVPAFTVLSVETWCQARILRGDLAVIAPLPRQRLEPVLRSLAASDMAAVCISNHHGSEDLAWARSIHAGSLMIPPQVALPDMLVALCTEVLARLASEERALAAERLAAENQHFATLGRYIVEIRHSFNNAMTSLLGNAELLLMQPGALPARASEQLQTIRAMAMRMNQMMLRLSSLESEMEIVESFGPENVTSLPQRKVET